MKYNKLQINKVGEKKVLRKVKKNWVVMSLASFALVGGMAMSSMTTASTASADEATQTTATTSTSSSNDSTITTHDQVETKTTTRIIKFIDKDSKQEIANVEPIKQTVNWTRTNKVDAQGNVVSEGTWQSTDSNKRYAALTSDNLDQSKQGYTTPQIDGKDVTQVDAKDADVNQTDEEVTVTYTKVQETSSIMQATENTTTQAANTTTTQAAAETTTASEATTNAANTTSTQASETQQTVEGLDNRLGATGSTYDYATLASQGAIKTNSISWKFNDGDQLDTGTMDYANPDGKTKISFTIEAGKLKSGDVIRIPVKTNLDNQPLNQNFNISNLNPVIYDSSSNQGISKSTTVSDYQYIEVPLDGDGFNPNVEHEVTIVFTPAGGMVFPKTASNGADLSFSETIADQTHTYHWAPKTTTPDFNENNTVGPMSDGISSRTNSGITVATRVSNTEGLPFTQAVPLNNGNDYIQTITVTATTVVNGQVVPVTITPGSMNPYVTVSNNFGPATEASGWTDQAANNWGGTSNATRRMANWFTQASADTPGENQYSIIKLSDNSYKVVINYGKSQALAYSKTEFERIIKSQYAHVSDQVIADMENRYGDGNGNVIMPYSIQASIPFTNPNNLEGNVKYDASFADNKGKKDEQSAMTTPINQNTAAGQTKFIVKYVDESSGKELIYEQDSFGYESHNDQYSGKSVAINNYTLDTSQLPAGAVATGDGQYAVNGTYKADWENGTYTIIYYYIGVPAQAKVRYVLDEDGNTNTTGDWADIDNGADNETLNGRFHQKFTTSAKDFSSRGYFLVQVINGPDGRYDATDDQTITYVYAQYRTLTVDYVDQDNNNQKIDGDTYTYTNSKGKYNVLDSYRTTETLAALEAKGYELVSDPYPSTGYTFGADTNAHYTVVLKHRQDQSTKIKTVTRTIKYVDAITGKEIAPSDVQSTSFIWEITEDAVTHKVVVVLLDPGSQGFSYVPSPEVANYRAPDFLDVLAEGVKSNDTDSVFTVSYDHKYTSSEETKTFTRTIKYLDAVTRQEIAPEKTETVTLKRSVLTDDVTGDKTYGDWNTGSWDEVDSPSVAGYDAPDKAKIDQQDVNINTGDANEEVLYNHHITLSEETENITRTIKYIDAITGNEIAPEKTQTVTLNRSVSTDDVTGNKTYGDWNTVSWDEVDSPAVAGYDAPDRSKVDAANVTPDTKDDTEVVKYNHHTDTKTETKTVTRTIKYVDAVDGHEVAKEVQQPVTFTRTATTDAVTHDVTYSAWTQEGTWSAVNSPVIAGYDAPDRAKVDAANVTSETQDDTEVVKYNKTVTPVTPVNPTPEPAKPVLPSTSGDTTPAAPQKESVKVEPAKTALPSTGKEAKDEAAMKAMVGLVLVSLTAMIAVKAKKH